MSEGYNKAVLCGNLGADPELRFTQNNAAVLNFRMATTESYKGADGQKAENVQWHNVAVWGNRAEPLSKILKKGSRVLVEGRIENRSYDDKEGIKRTASSVNASNIVLMDSRRDGDSQGDGGQRQQGNGGQRSQQSNGQRPQQQRPQSGGNAQRPANNNQRQAQRPNFDDAPPADDFAGEGGGADNEDIPF